MNATAPIRTPQEVRAPRPSEEGTVPVMIMLDHNEEPKVGDHVRYRVEFGKNWWSHMRTGIVDSRNVDGCLFIRKMHE